jgi:hypothetical protein
MFVVSEEAVVAIRTTYDQEGELYRDGHLPAAQTATGRCSSESVFSCLYAHAQSGMLATTSLIVRAVRRANREALQQRRATEQSELWAGASADSRL